MRLPPLCAHGKAEKHACSWAAAAAGTLAFRPGYVQLSLLPQRLSAVCHWEIYLSKAAELSQGFYHAHFTFTYSFQDM